MLESLDYDGKTAKGLQFFGNRYSRRIISTVVLKNEKHCSIMKLFLKGTAIPFAVTAVSLLLF